MLLLAKDPEFFHVVVYRLPAAGIALLLMSDLSEKELRRRFVKPYRHGKTVKEAENIVDLRSITSVEIIKSQLTYAQMLDAFERHEDEKEKRMSPQPFSLPHFHVREFWLDDRVADFGKNVTDQYIHGPAGTAFSWTRFFNNPWIVGVGLLVIGLITGYFLGSSG